MKFVDYLQAQTPEGKLVLVWDGASYYPSPQFRDFLSQLNQGENWKVHGLRGCFRSSESLRKSFEHELNHGQVDEGLPSAWQFFIVLAEPPAPGNPGQGALHHPTPGD